MGRVGQGIGQKTGSQDWFWSVLNSYLSKEGLKQTKQRLAVVEQFLKVRSHVDVESIHATLRKKGMNIGLATIYRTLNMLKDAGLVHQHFFSDGRAVFEIASPDTHHDHLVCTVCGQIDEFENDAIEQIQQQIAAEMGYVLESHRLELYGRCKTCQKNR